MKQQNIKTLGLFIAVFTVALSGCSTQGTEKISPYPFDTAKIEYELSGDITGTISVVIKGDQSSHETNATEESTGESIHNKLLDKGEYLYQIDIKTNQGQKAKNPIHEQLKALPQEERMAFLTKLAVGAGIEGDDPKSVGEKAVAGETCKLYEVQNIGEICLWNGLPLYSSMSIPEAGIQSTNTAVSIQLNVDVPDSTFDVPSDANITEVE